MADRVATIRPIPGLADLPMYAIAYTVDGESAGGSLARGDEIDEWRTDLAAAGWRVVHASDTT